MAAPPGGKAEIIYAKINFRSHGKWRDGNGIGQWRRCCAIAGQLPK
jgi:hypothetical protein